MDRGDRLHIVEGDDEVVVVIIVIIIATMIVTVYSIALLRRHCCWKHTLPTVDTKFLQIGSSAMESNSATKGSTGLSPSAADPFP